MGAGFACARRPQETLAMVEAPPTIAAKIVPSRDRGHFIDGSLSLDRCRVGWIGGDGSLGPNTETLPFRAHGSRYMLTSKLPKGFAETTRARWQQGCHRPAFTHIFFFFRVAPSRSFHRPAGRA
jgi:hypothetical protein